MRVDRLMKRRLEKLADSTGRSRSFLAAEALTNYLDVNEWQVAGIREAMTSINRGDGITHANIRQWVDSWNTKREAKRS